MAEETNNSGKGFGEEGSFASKLVDGFQKTFGLQNEVNSEARKAVSKLGTQVKFTQDLINKNRKKLEKIAETDSDVAKFLDSFDNTNFAKMEELRQEIMQGNKISEKDGKFLANTFQELQSTFGSLGVDGLEQDLGTVMKQLQETIMSDELDRETQREFLNDFIGVVENAQDLSEDQLATLELLKEEQKKGFNFEAEQLETLNDIFQFFEESKIGEIKQQGTLDDMSRKFSSFLVNQDEIKTALEEQQFDGEALVDILKDGLDSELGMGISDLLLGALGLPGLATALKGAGDFAKKAKNLITNGFSKIFGKSGILSRIFGKGGFIGKAVGKFAKIFGSVTKVFGSVSKIAGPVLKASKFLKAIPVVGTIIAAVMGIFDAVSGFFNADEISGKSAEMLTLGDKIQASISSFISGLTFGFLKAEDIFQWFDKAKESLFGEEGFFSGVGDFFTGVIDGVKNFDAMEFVDSTIESVTTGIGDFFSSFTDFIVEGIDEMIKKVKEISVKDFLPDSLTSFFGGDDDAKAKEEFDRLQKEEPSFLSKIFSSDDDNVSPPPSTRAIQRTETADIGSTASTAMSREETVRARSNQQSSQAQVVPVPVGGAESGGKTPNKRNQIDDMQLSAISVGLLD